MNMSMPSIKAQTGPTKSLYRYLGLVVLACIALPALVSGGVLIYSNYQRTIAIDSRAEASGYADVLQAGMSVPLWNLSPDLGQPTVENVFIDPAVLAVEVYTETGKKFLQYVRSDVRLENALVVERDVNYDGKIIGRLKLSYSLEKAKTQANKDAEFLIIIICAQLLVSLAAISVLLHRRVLSPLQKLDAAAAGIAQGDLRTTIPKLDNDEFGRLSQRLERMRLVLEESFTELEERVELRTAELQTLNKTLKGTLDQLQKTQDNLVQSEKLAALGSLVAGVAHELNTPIGNGLTVISSLCTACENFNREVESGLTRSALEKFKRDMDEGTHLVCRNLEKASELVSSFKQVAVDRTSAKRRKFSLKAFLEETLLTVSPLYKRTPFRVELIMESDLTMDSYPGPLGQVVTNLLNNAIIHAFCGSEEGLVEVRVKSRNEDVEILVKDNGVGIPFEYQPKIFDPFFTTKLGEGGNGLGMNIVHNIVTGVLGGVVTLTSEPNLGTTFSLILPVRAPEDALDAFNIKDAHEVNRLAS